MTLERRKAEELAGGLLDGGRWRAESFGAGKFSDVFLVRAVDGTEAGEAYVLRVAPPDSLLQLFYEYRMMRQEPGIHARLLAETSVPVPPVVGSDFSRERIDRDYLIMPRLEGVPLIEAHLPPRAERRALREWGGYVRQIHSLTDPGGRFGYLGEHECMEPQATWRDAFAIMYRKLLDDVVACGVYDEPTARRAMDLLEAHLGAFEHCRESRLLHGDLWAANLLVARDGEVTGVLDFDRACWGDVEWDLAIADYCGVTQPAFWEGYGRTVDNRSGEAGLRRMLYLLYEHQKYIVISMSARRNDPHRARRYAEQSLAVMRRFEQTAQPEF